MTDNRLSLFLVGANYNGVMATSQRVHNLFEPLIKGHKIRLENVEYVPSKCTYMSKVIYAGKLVLSLRRLAKTGQTPIIYHYSYPSILTIPVLWLAKLYHYPMVFDIIENIYAYSVAEWSWRKRLQYKIELVYAPKYMQKANKCFAISSALINVCKRLTNGKVETRLLSISVDVEKMKSIVSNDGHRTEIRIFYGGSFGNKDGINYLIKGFEKAWSINSNLRLYMTGRVAKEAKGKFEKLISQSPAKAAISYLGCLPIEEYYRTMAKSDILCMPRVNSNFANSGFPFKLGEYLATGKAVLATRTSDIEVYLTHRESAFLIPPEEVDAWRDGLIELSANSALRQKIGRNGQLVALEHFDVNVVSNFLFSELNNI